MSETETRSGMSAARDTVDFYRRRVVMAVQAAFMLAAVFAFFLYPGWDRLHTVVSVGFLLSLLSIYLVRDGKHQVLGNLILAGQFLVIPPFLAILSMGIHDATMFIMPAAMLVISLTSMPRFVWTYNALMLLSAGLVFYASLHGYIGDTLTVSSGGNLELDGVMILVILLFCSCASGFLATILERLLAALSNNEQELESRVTARTADLAQSNLKLKSTLTTLEQAKDDLVRGERLASLGSIVAGVAHELNTPIGNAMITATALEAIAGDFQKQLSAPLQRSSLHQFVSRVSEASAIIGRNLERAGALVGDFKQVAVDQTSQQRREFSLDELVGEILVTLRPMFGRTSHDVSVSIPAQIRMHSYPGPLGQVLTNLIANALIHGFEGRENGRIEISAAEPAQDKVRLSIRDNGAGIPDEIRHQIFDPFFTTRLGQGGSGLGLHIVQNLVHDSLFGSLSLESVAGSGTTFHIDLPRDVTKLPQAA